MENTEQQSFDSWAVVELFGHQQIAGHVSNASIGGASFLRVDVPEQPAVAPGSDRYGYARAAKLAVPAYTRYFSAGAIYALNPCSEEAARGAARNLRAEPPIPYQLPPSAPALAAPADDDLATF